MEYDPDQDGDETAGEQRQYADDATGLDRLDAAIQDWSGHLEEGYGGPDEHELYEAAQQALDGVGTVTADELDAVVAGYDDAPWAPQMGVFMSAAYDHIEDDTIVHTARFRDDVAEHPGYALDEDQTLVLEEPADEVGHKARGTIIVRSDMDEHGFATFCYADVVSEAATEMLAVGSTGVVVNDDEADFMYPATTGIAVNRGEVRRIANMDSGITINTGTVEDPVPQRQQDGQEGIEHLAPVGITINYGEATPAVAGGLVIDAAQDDARIYHDGTELLRRSEAPEAELWQELDAIHEIVTQEDGTAVIAGLEQYADQYRLEDRFTADHDGDADVPKQRFRIGGRLERLFEEARSE